LVGGGRWSDGLVDMFGVVDNFCGLYVGFGWCGLVDVEVVVYD
jgi:hypothetical protein